MTFKGRLNKTSKFCVTSLMVDSTIIGQPPLITLQPGLGVPATCLADFFEAVDRHMQRLEADLAFHLGQVRFSTKAIQNYLISVFWLFEFRVIPIFETESKQIDTYVIAKFF